MKKLLLSMIVVIGFNAKAQTTIFEDSFEFYDDFAIANVGEWTLTDVDQRPAYTIGAAGAFVYANAGGLKSFQVFNAGTVVPALTPGTAASNWVARTGDRHMVCFAAVPGAGITANNDWLISPQITLGTSNTVSFWAKPCSTQYGAERFSVSVSSTGVLPANFTKISAGNYITTPVNTTWVEYTYTIPASYDNHPVYIAINCVSNDQYGFAVDDFKVTGTVLATENFVAKNFVVYPNPANNVLNISNKNNVAITQMQITDLNGRVVKNVNANETQINIADLTAGVYFLKINSDQGSGSTKIIKK